MPDCPVQQPREWNLRLRTKLTASLAGVALSLLAAPAYASEPATAELWKMGDFGAVVATDGVTDTGDSRFTFVSFGQHQYPDSPPTPELSLYESWDRNGTKYTVRGSLTGRAASGAYTVRGLTGGEVRAVIPVSVCTMAWWDWQETCVDGTRRVDATVNAVDQGELTVNRVSYPMTGCRDFCWSGSWNTQSRAAAGSIAVDGQARTGQTSAHVGRTLIMDHYLIRPALATSE